jgi:hypothetical protein
MFKKDIIYFIWSQDYYHLEVGKWKQKFIWGPPNDATINISKFVLSYLSRTWV